MARQSKKNDENTQQCFAAIAQRDLVAARALLEAGANPNAKDKDGTPMLFYSRWFPAADLLLEFGADINVRNDMGHTMLHKAAEYGSRQEVESLLARGADLHARNRNDVTVLHSATGNITNGRELCELLIGLGVSPDSWTKNQYLPAHFAASHGALDTCRFFTELGYSSSLVPDNALPEYKTPFQCAVSSANIEKVQYYMDECGESLDQITLDGRPMSKLVNKVHVGMHAFLKSVATIKAVGAVIGSAAPAQASGRSKSFSPI